MAIPPPFLRPPDLRARPQWLFGGTEPTLTPADFLSPEGADGPDGLPAQPLAALSLIASSRRLSGVAVTPWTMIEIPAQTTTVQ